MLVTITDEDGLKITDYNCPVLERPQHSLTSLLRHKYIRFRPSVQQFAEYYNYHIPDISKAFEDLDTYGCGKHMYPETLRKFKNDVIRTSEEVRASWTFKRSSIEDEDDILDIEDPPQL